jgi:hypothetical protein
MDLIKVILLRGDATETGRVTDCSLSLFSGLKLHYCCLLFFQLRSSLSSLELRPSLLVSVASPLNNITFKDLINIFRNSSSLFQLESKSYRTGQKLSVMELRIKRNKIRNFVIERCDLSADYMLRIVLHTRGRRKFSLAEDIKKIFCRSDLWSKISHVLVVQLETFSPSIHYCRSQLLLQNRMHSKNNLLSNNPLFSFWFLYGKKNLLLKYSEFEKSSLTKLIFTKYLCSLQKLSSNQTKKSSSSLSIFKTWHFKNQVQIDRELASLDTFLSSKPL